MGETFENLTNEELCDFMCGQPEKERRKEMSTEDAIKILSGAGFINCDLLCGGILSGSAMGGGGGCEHCMYKLALQKGIEALREIAEKEDNDD